MRGVSPARGPSGSRVAELLAVVGLTGFEHRRVTELSGGEAKRVALARSLAPAPRVLLLDEPLTGLDRELHDRLAGELGGDPAGDGHDVAARHPRPRRGGHGGRSRRADGRAGSGRDRRPDERRDPPAAGRRPAHGHAVARRRVGRRRRAGHDATSAHAADGDLVAISTWMPTVPDAGDRRSAARDGGRRRPRRAAGSARSCSPPGSTRAVAGGATCGVGQRPRLGARLLPTPRVRGRRRRVRHRRHRPPPPPDPTRSASASS